jgi:hypothetical protein
MTNWTQNTLTLFSDDAGLLTEVEEALATGAEDGEPLTFEAVVPLGEWDYDRAVDAWGTKWDARETTLLKTETTLTYLFETAWAPPLPVVRAISTKWPGLVVHVKAREDGNSFLFGAYMVDGRDVLVADEDPEEHVVCEECGVGMLEDGEDKCEECEVFDLVEPSSIEFDAALAEEFAPVKVQP